MTEAKNETAATVQLKETEGTVTVSKAGGAALPMIKNMKLNDGNHVATEESSYAWLQLDSTKLAKVDAVSEMELRKSGGVLELLIHSGGLYFNVSEKLSPDETMNISTSTMIAGIRGTCGWVEEINQWHTRVYIIEGIVQCSVTDPITGQTKTGIISGGEWADFYVYDRSGRGPLPPNDIDKCDIVRQGFTVQDIPGYVLVELLKEENKELRDKVLENYHIDLNGITIEEAQEKLKAEQEELHGRLEEIKAAAAELENNISQDPVWVDDTDIGEAEDVNKQKNAPDAGEQEETAETQPEPENTGSSSSSGGSSSSNTENSVVTYTITYETYGGTINSGNVTSYTYGVGATLPTDISRGTYEFKGWYDNENFSGSEVTAISTSETGNKTYYAKLELTGTCGTGVTWVLNGNGNMVISGSGAMTSAPASSNKEDVKKVTIESGVTSIASSAFKYCTYLTNATIPDSVSSIGGDAFYNSGLTSVKIPDAVTKIDSFTFYGCSGLTDVTIGNGVTGIFNSSFASCTSLTSINIPNGVTYIASSAFDTSGLTSIVIPDSVIDIQSGAFNRCSNLESITVSPGNTKYDSRDNCNAIIETRTLITGCKNTVIPDTVTSIGQQAFNGCTGLTSITIPDSVRSIQRNAFFNCTNLTSVNIPTSVDTIQNNAFSGCTSLTNVTIPDSVTSIGSNAFNNVPHITYHGTYTTNSPWGALAIN